MRNNREDFRFLSLIIPEILFKDSDFSVRINLLKVGRQVSFKINDLRQYFRHEAKIPQIPSYISIFDAIKVQANQSWWSRKFRI